MGNVTNSLPTVLRLDGLQHRLTDKAKSEHFTVYVDQPLEFVSQDFIGLLGPSGCGKTTLLTVLGLLREPTHVEDLRSFELFVPVAGEQEQWQRVDLREAWRKRQGKMIERLRRQYFGFALQTGELISSLTVRENIAMPLKLNGWKTSDSRRRVESLVEQFRLHRIRHDQANPLEEPASSGEKEQSDAATGSPATAASQDNALADSRINRLSGGEYQRVALARSIAHRPTVVFVDEPTSALNRELAYGALSVMRDLQRHRAQAGITFMITHDERLAEEFCNVVVRMMPRKNEPAGEVVEVIRHDPAAEEGSAT